MTETMKRKIFVDFEWNAISGDYPEQRLLAQNEIVEFGAVMLDSDKQEISRFQKYVKPEYVKKICKFLQKNSGITDELLKDSQSFTTVLADFLSWCEDERGGYEIYSWSNSDLAQIKAEIRLKNVEETETVKYMIENWFDLQCEYDTTLGFCKNQSLSNALFMAGIDFEGKAHHALDDARNTSKLYIFLTDPKEKETTIRTIQSVLRPERETFTLGDMIDWSKLRLECSC